LALSPDSLALDGDPLVAFERQSPAFAEIAAKVRASWEAAPPRFLPLEYGLLDRSQLPADAAALIERSVGERPFTLVDGVDVTAASIIKATTSAAQSAGPLGGGVVAARALKLSAARLTGPAPSSGASSSSASIAALRKDYTAEHFTTQTPTRAPAAAATVALSSSASLDALQPATTGSSAPFSGMFAPRRSITAATAHRLATGQARHKVQLMSTDEVAANESARAPSGEGVQTEIRYKQRSMMGERERRGGYAHAHDVHVRTPHSTWPQSSERPRGAGEKGSRGQGEGGA
jgi:hypothetical protein